MKVRRAFTIVELLVVISIIILLAALLFPAIAAARKYARTAACSSQLRQIGMATKFYAEEYDDHFPFAGHDWPYGSVVDPWLALQPYLNSPRSIICPADSSPTWAERWYELEPRTFPQGLGVRTSYYLGYPFYHRFDRNQNPGPALSMSQSEVVYPSLKFMVVCYSTAGTGLAHGADGQNCLFVDGHVQRVLWTKMTPTSPFIGNHDWCIGGLGGRDIYE